MNLKVEIVEAEGNEVQIDRINAAKVEVWVHIRDRDIGMQFVYVCDYMKFCLKENQNLEIDMCEMNLSSVYTLLIVRRALMTHRMVNC